MIFGWLKKQRRKKILATPFPEHWNTILETHIPQVEVLTPEQQNRLRRQTQVFVAEKNWEGIDGLQLTETIQVTIAGMMALLIVGLPEEEYFDHVLSILVYPDLYVMKKTSALGATGVLESHEARVGEAHYRGPVIVSWSDVSETARNESFGRNVVLHEFAHQLDMLNGRFADGNPQLPSPDRYREWDEVMQRGFEELSRACRSGERTLIDCYGATNRAEFFAVTTELFFEAPTPLRYWHPDIYQQLSRFYGLDPANWGT